MPESRPPAFAASTLESTPCHLTGDSDRIAPTGGATPCHAASDKTAAATVLELRVRNHPGAMSHITGLFARRGFNLEAILCVPVAGTAESRMLLLVATGSRLEQVERQLARLFDVLAIRHRPDVTPGQFAQSMPAP